MLVEQPRACRDRMKLIKRRHRTFSPYVFFPAALCCNNPDAPHWARRDHRKTPRSGDEEGTGLGRRQPLMHRHISWTGGARERDDLVPH